MKYGINYDLFSTSFQVYFNRQNQGETWKDYDLFPLLRDTAFVHTSVAATGTGWTEVQTRKGKRTASYAQA